MMSSTDWLLMFVCLLFMCGGCRYGGRRGDRGAGRVDVHRELRGVYGAGVLEVQEQAVRARGRERRHEVDRRAALHARLGVLRRVVVQVGEVAAAQRDEVPESA